MNIQYRAFHFCPRPDGKGLTVTRPQIYITLRDAIRQLTPNVDTKYFGFCFYPDDVQGYLRKYKKCSWAAFEGAPLTNGAVLTRSDIGRWILPGYPNPWDALPTNGKS